MNQKPENLSTIQVLAVIARRTMPVTSHERIFLEWMEENSENLKAACEKLGVTIEPGPNFYKRLKNAALPRILLRKFPEECPF